MQTIIKANRKQLLKVIRLHCIKCMGSTRAVRQCQSKDCDLYEYRMRPSQMSKQTDIFRINDKADFSDILIKTANENMPDTFWFSELRKASRVYPLHHNSWGTIATCLIKNGYKRTGQMRKNPITSTKGHLDFQYTRLPN